MTLTVTILGCGSSGGVPRVGQGWGACDPANPKNRRRRCSILVEQASPGGTTTIIIDTGPDLREQLLGVGVMRLDAVLYTHDHADHTHGIDDVRPIVLAMRRRLDAYADDMTRVTLSQRFGYCFASQPGSDYPPIINLHSFAAYHPVSIDGPGGEIAFTPLPVTHGANYRSFAFRFSNIVYCPDISAISDKSEEHFHGARVLVLDALRYTRHPTHFNVDEALALIERVRPERAILTNLHSDLDYDVLAKGLPEHIVPAYDGMTFDAV